mmetsp:Transcript_30592/g.62440  ORF Transcript_30592/g.62440 Transcript_30592/m.62440 type:complete len:157 (-) Transcript_30592:1186-1656(-)
MKVIICESLPERHREEEDSAENPLLIISILNEGVLDAQCALFQDGVFSEKHLTVKLATAAFHPFLSEHVIVLIFHVKPHFFQNKKSTDIWTISLANPFKRCFPNGRDDLIHQNATCFSWSVVLQSEKFVIVIDGNGSTDLKCMSNKGIIALFLSQF